MFSCSVRRCWITLLTIALLPLAGCGVDPGGTDDPGDDPAGMPLEDQVGSGSARVTGWVLSSSGENPLPIGGVTLVLGDAVSHSNVDGSFILLGVPDGRQPFRVDGNDVVAGDGFYGQFASELAVTAGEDLVLERPVYLPFVSYGATTTVLLDGTTIVRGRTGGEQETFAVLEIPPGGARRNGREYDGPISLHLTPAERTPMPLPERFGDGAGVIVSIQPVDVEFPVPVRLSVVATEQDSTQTDHLWSLWSFEPTEADYYTRAVGRRDGGMIATTSGGVRAGGCHFFTDLVVELVEPLFGADADAARACLTARLDLLAQVQELARLELPGARTVLGRLGAVLEKGAGSSSADAATVLTLSSGLYARAQEALAAYQDLYVQRLTTQALKELQTAAALARGGCGILDAPLPEDDEISYAVAEAQLEAALTRVQAHVAQDAVAFDRLRTAATALEPFYQTLDPALDNSLDQFRLAAREFNGAYGAFSEYSTPVDAYDALVADLALLEDSARTLVALMSEPAVGAGDGGARLVRVGGARGTTQVSFADARGEAELQLDPERDASDAYAEASMIVALDPTRALCSLPVPESTFAEELDRRGAPVIIGLTRIVAQGTLTMGIPVAGELTSEAPLHVWRFDARAREGVHADFAALGQAVAGLATADDLVQAAGYSGFDVANLTGGGALAVHVLAPTSANRAPVPYQLAVSPREGLFDFDTPVTGTFDVTTRVAAVLFEAQAGERIYIEKATAGAYSYQLLGPDGALVTRTDYQDAVAGQGSEAFDLDLTGLHRVIVTPAPGAFGLYDLTIHRVPPLLPQVYAPGFVATGVIDQVGQVARYTFTLEEDYRAALVGVSAVGLDPAYFTLSGPDGAGVLDEGLLYFDGSTFATRGWDRMPAGVYGLAFRAPFDGVSLTGSFTFRVDLLGLLESEPETESPDDSLTPGTEVERGAGETP